MRWTACDCRAAYYARVKRSAWMRLAFGRKLYRCHACEAEMLLDPDLNGALQDVLTNYWNRNETPEHAQQAFAQAIKDNTW